MCTVRFPVDAKAFVHLVFDFENMPESLVLPEGKEEDVGKTLTQVQTALLKELERPSTRSIKSDSQYLASLVYHLMVVLECPDFALSESYDIKAHWVFDAFERVRKSYGLVIRGESPAPPVETVKGQFTADLIDNCKCGLNADRIATLIRVHYCLPQYDAG